MSPSRDWMFQALLAVWLCSSSLLIGAQDDTATQDGITNPTEVRALRVIKQSLIDPFNNLSNWNRGDPCTSNWTGVLCFNTTKDDGYLHVRELQLLRMNLSGSLSPELGRLTYLEILDFMWNSIRGSIPKEIGNITSLKLLLLNGNQLTGPLPEELGNLANLDRIQIDQNQISGPIPKSFANLTKTKHFHMNNNSISGQIPPELSTLPSLVHFLLDNNNLSGYLPREFSELPNLLILQVDNNNFDGSTIPDSYGNMYKLLKMSLRNCSLQGPIPDLSRIPNLGYLDLSSNQLNGSIPPNKLSENITTIDLSNNNLIGSIPTNFSGLPRLQRLSLANNSLNGSVPSNLWQRTFNASDILIINLENNNLSNISGSPNIPSNVTMWLRGNPLCSNSNAVQFCGSQTPYENDIDIPKNSTVCPSQSCPPPHEYAPASFEHCFCAVPLLIGYRLKSPGFSGFVPYYNAFEEYLTSGLSISLYQLDFHFIWEEGPRLRMGLKIFPAFDNSTHLFDDSEVQRIMSMFTGWNIPDSDVFGPYELLNYTLLGPYEEAIPTSRTSGRSKGALAGIVLGVIAGAVTLSAIVFLIVRMHLRTHHSASKRRLPISTFSQPSPLTAASTFSAISTFSQPSPLTAASTFSELLGIGPSQISYSVLRTATGDFIPENKLGEGGFGPVYKGTLPDGRLVAVKRLSVASHHGKSQFMAEIAIISAVQHRNLVKLYGWCISGTRRLLVYEYLENKSLDQALFGKNDLHLDWPTRFNICLGTARGLAYLHEESRPRIVHRDVKASNILLDAKLCPKISDFGLAKLYDDTKTHLSTRVAGTIGYLAPEYAMRGHLTEKADVFGFGVVALEILSGRPNNDNSLDTEKKYLLEWAWTLHESDRSLDLVDPTLIAFDESEATRVIGVALLCTQASPMVRPPMSRVVAMLAGDIEVRAVTTKPSYLTDWDFEDITSSLQNQDAHVSIASDSSRQHSILQHDSPTNPCTNVDPTPLH